MGNEAVDELFSSGSDNSGSPKTDPSNANGGESGAGKAGGTVPKEQYAALEEKLGKQGEELGAYRKLYEDLSPLLDKLDDSPEIAKAIMEGKIDSSLASKLLSGELSQDTATKVTEATETVRKELGDKAFDKLDKKELESMIKAAVDEVKTVQTREIHKIESKREYEQQVQEFISSHDDFPAYAEQIEQWFKENPKQYDIKVAYYAVKGAMASKSAEAAAAEKAKNAVPGMGGSSGTGVGAGEDLFTKMLGNTAGHDEIF